MPQPSRKFPGSRRPSVRKEDTEEPAGRSGRRDRNRKKGPGTPREVDDIRLDDSGAGPRRGGATRPGGAEGRRISQGRKGGPVRNRPGKDGPQGRLFQKGWKREELVPVGEAEVRFSDLLMQAARKAAPDKVEHPKHPEPLARLDYALELELKNKALQEYWIARGLPDKPNQILASPRPRHYRTTSKRRIVHIKGRFELTNLTASQDDRAAKAGSESRVEPLEHRAIYALILAKLNTQAYAQLAHALNYVIIRGDYSRFTVLLNVHKLSGDVVRKAKLLSGHLQEMDSPNVGAAFVFYDPSRSEFYLEARNAEGPWKMKKLFGPEEMHLQVLDRTYTFHPTAFCQVNASILPLFLEKSVQLLKPKPEYRLLDLYSGFGFFTLHLGPSYGEAHGVDFGSGSIDSAQRMAKADPDSHCTFRSGRIQVKSLGKLLPPASPDRPEAILLDPPRQGTEPGVIRALASRTPARILHIFCDLDTLPKEVNQWRKCGYMVSKVLPLDMFPGTDNLEVMVLFIPDRYGILNRIDKGQHDKKAEPEADAAPEEPESAARFERSKLPRRTDRPRRPDIPGRGENSRYAERNRDADRKRGPGGSQETNRTDGLKPSSWADRPDRTANPDPRDPGAESGKPKHSQFSKRPAKQDDSGRPRRPSRPGKPFRPGRPGSR